MEGAKSEEDRWNHTNFQSSEPTSVRCGQLERSPETRSGAQAFFPPPPEDENVVAPEVVPERLTAAVVPTLQADRRYRKQSSSGLSPVLEEVLPVLQTAEAWVAPETTTFSASACGFPPEEGPEMIVLAEITLRVRQQLRTQGWVPCSVRLVAPSSERVESVWLLVVPIPFGNGSGEVLRAALREVTAVSAMLDPEVGSALLVEVCSGASMEPDVSLILSFENDDESRDKFSALLKSFIKQAQGSCSCLYGFESADAAYDDRPNVSRPIADSDKCKENQLGFAGQSTAPSAAAKGKAGRRTHGRSSCCFRAQADVDVA